MWRLPLYNTVHNILTNLVYAGAYAFGRTMSRVSGEDGRKRVKRFATPAVGMGYAAQGLARRLYHLERVRAEPAGDCQQCDRQRLCGHWSSTARRTTLGGLLRCAHCGRKIYVGYGGKAERNYCHGALVNHGTARCISFGGLRASKNRGVVGRPCVVRGWRSQQAFQRSCPGSSGRSSSL